MRRNIGERIEKFASSSWEGQGAGMPPPSWSCQPSACRQCAGRCAGRCVCGNGQHARASQVHGGEKVQRETAVCSSLISHRLME